MFSVKNIKSPLTKDQITQDALLILRGKGARVRKVHNVGAYKKRSHQVEPGWPDIQGFDIDGKVILVEVKTLNDHWRPEQIKLLTDCFKCGGMVMVATEINHRTAIIDYSHFINAFNKLKN